MRGIFIPYRWYENVSKERHEIGTLLRHYFRITKKLMNSVLAERTDKIDLFLGKRRMVGSENIVEPKVGLTTLRTGFVPSVDGVCLSRHEAPIDGANSVFFEERHDGFEGTL